MRNEMNTYLKYPIGILAGMTAFALAQSGYGLVALAVVVVGFGVAEKVTR